MTKIAAGQTYAQVSAKSLADPKNATLHAQKAALFPGETLRCLLLGAWGWSVSARSRRSRDSSSWLSAPSCSCCPLANWQMNLRGRGRALAGA